MASTAKTVALLGLAGLAILLQAAGAGAQTATDVRCRKCVDGGDLAKGAVVKRTIAKKAVTGGKIAPGAVNAARLADGGVTGAKIQNGAATEEKVRNGAVSTAEIAPLAVTGDKIAPLAVTGPKLATGAATGDKIVAGAVIGSKLQGGAVGAAALASNAVTSNTIADGSVGTNDLAGGAVGAAQIVPGAVTGDALAGTSITGAKFAAGAVTEEKFARGVGKLKLVRTIVIGPTGTPTQNCDALRNALIGIADNAADSRYVIKLEPGLYDCGALQLAMKSFVDIEGSGEGVTTISGSPGGSEAVLELNDDAELRFLSVLDTGGDDFSRAISLGDGRMRQVTAVAVNGARDARTIVAFGNAMLRDVTVRATSAAGANLGPAAIGIFVLGPTSMVTLEDTTVTADGPIGNEAAVFIRIDGRLAARHSVFSAPLALVLVGRADLADTQLDGGTSFFASTILACAGVYDVDFMALDGTCN